MTRSIRAIYTWQSTKERMYLAGTIGASLIVGSGRLRCMLDGSQNNAVKFPNNDPGAALGYSYIACSDTVVTLYAGAATTECMLVEVGSYQIFAVKIDASTYNLRLKKASDSSTLGTGSTAFSFGTQYDWVIGRDTTSVRLYWNDMTAPEITGAQSGSVDVFRCKTTNVDATAYVEYGPMVFLETNVVGNDRPDPSTFAAGGLFVTSGTPMHDEYTHDESGTPKTNAWESVDDISDPDDDTTYLENPATADTGPYRQTFVTSSPTISNCKAVMVLMYGRATVASKSQTVKQLIGDGTNLLELGSQTVTLNTYQPAGIITELAPDGSAISQTDLDNMQIGVSWEIGADAVTYRLTSIFAEALGFDYNPEDIGVAAQRRRGGVF